jgi:rhamnose utilization protein RhaD (predicted bifunctional aldolase and dehydrogenase)/NAD(P)-dependent dehydrogenase (short-subunit alcohol dehydrogenase family)
MKSLWDDADAEKAVRGYAAKGIGRDLALRVYTTRLLGGDPRLVMHGGGNTSVKTRMRDLLGEEIDALCVKGSGWDMAVIEPPGLPALRLEPLRKLRALAVLTDEDMVSFQRSCLLDANSPNPSVETLFHAFLPHKYIDHTHSNAVCALTDQPDGPKICAELYGETCVLVPYVMPGFALAKMATEAFETNRKSEGLVLLKHGIFTYAEDCREAYERMIKLVSRAEERLAKGKTTLVVNPELPRDIAPLAEVAPILRGAVAQAIDKNDGAWRRQILEFRTGPAIRSYVDAETVAELSRRGVPTPDHVIRTKGWPLVVPAPAAGELAGFAAKVKAAVEAYAADYRAYFARQNARQTVKRKELDPLPRTILVPGLGLFGLGASAKDAKIAADLAEAAAEVAMAAEGIGRFEPVTEADLFDVEYWSLEQAKLGKSAEKRLARQVALVTGAGSGIGAAIAKAFAAEGAEVVLLDRDEASVKAAAKAASSTALGLVCDVTDRSQIRAAFDKACATFGGVDVMVSNAGAAWQGKIGEVSDADLRRSFELNFFAHQNVAQEAVRIFRTQGTGGCLLFNASKQAVNPGPDFGPYGLPKAATLFLSRQYAVDYGGEGIRSNAVNADRVNTGIFAGGLLESRAKARGLTVEQYLSQGNLLQREVKVSDVAQAFVDLALAAKSTGAVMTVDGGNIAAALR